RSSWLLVRGVGTPSGTSLCQDYLAYDDDRDYLAVGARAKIGVLLRPVRRFTFGLVVTTPTAHVFGVAHESATVTRGEGSSHAALPLRASGSSEVALPARIALGFGVVRKRYTFSADFSINFPHTVRLAYDMKAERISGMADPGP